AGSPPAGGAGGRGPRRPWRRDGRRVRAGTSGVNRLLILGVPVDAISEAGAVEWVADAIRAGQPRQVATVNPEFIMRARHDGRFLNVLSAADLCIPDGYGVVWAARRLGHRLPSRGAGVGLLRSLA